MKPKIYLVILILSLNNFNNFLAQDILVGADQTNSYLPKLKNKSVGLIVNHTSRAQKQNKHLIDILLENNIDLKKIFTPEHGLDGLVDAGEEIDSKIYYKNIEVTSLYGKKLKPQKEDLQDLDILVFDIQDIGVRFYTYISTMYYAMQASAENNLEFLILDRPNPNGFYVDGPVLDPKFKSFVGALEIPIVYGLTLAELANMINGEMWLDHNLKCDLDYVLCANYHHNKKYILPIKPSPNLPNNQAIYLYPSICFFEGTQISVGRGTDKQFQLIGSPKTNPKFIKKLKNYIEFSPISKPGASNPPHINTLCFGLDLSSLNLIYKDKINLNFLLDFYKSYDDKENFFLKTDNSYFFDLLAGTDKLRNQIITGTTEIQIRNSWEPKLTEFKKIRKKYLLYKP